ncbi:unnamed protein product [Soboliphyme baturini]|uniref:Secreted protein n=1 Tax=Soboliphyme baturini TaxID=241478 RepID=A0A183IZ25_9BILA|nr:unnamed protein product [Soboliphyme baturini]
MYSPCCPLLRTCIILKKNLNFRKTIMRGLLLWVTMLVVTFSTANQYRLDDASLKWMAPQNDQSAFPYKRIDPSNYNVGFGKRFDSSNFHIGFGRRFDPANFHLGFGKRFDPINYHMGFGKRSLSEDKQNDDFAKTAH